MKKVWMIGALSLALLGTAAGAAAGALACREQAQESVAEAAVLRQGSTGGEVKEVQRRLKNWGYYTGAVDGISARGRAALCCPFRERTGSRRTASWAGRRIRRSA